MIITLVFTAANVYFGLKAGLTFSTSIPAAVISMAILRSFKNATVQENNIVQTVASAAGTLSSIIFVLPGLIMIGWWTGFPFWISFLICALGGILGVMYSIPLRRALVTNSDLPYPEGVACAEVLKVGSGGDKDECCRSRTQPRPVCSRWCGDQSCPRSLPSSSRRKYSLPMWRKLSASGKRGAASGYDFSLSFALLAIGHLCGLSVGIAMLIGACIGWGWLVPYYSALSGDLTTAAGALAQSTWSHKVRFIGAGAIGVSAIWTLLKLVKPVVSGLAGAMAASRARKAGKADTLPITERDIPIGIVGLVTLVCMLPIGWVLGYFANEGGLGSHMIDAGHRRRGLCLSDELLRFGGLRLHGRLDRFIQQPALGHRHSGRDRRGVAARVRRQAIRRAGCGQGADGVRAFHHRRDLQRGRDREQQPAGSENRAIGRCDAVETAGRTHHRCPRRRRSHSARAQPGESGLRFRRRAGCGFASVTAACTASRPDLVARARRHRRGHRLEFDPDGRL